MRLNDYLSEIKEKFETGFKYKGEYVEVFKNPDRSEILDLKEEIPRSEVRFLADKWNSEVFVFPVNVLHQDVRDEIDLDRVYNEYFIGSGRIEGSKIEILEISMWVENLPYNLGVLLLDLINGRFDWMGRYNFKIEDFKEKVKKEYKKEIETFKNRDIERF